MSELTVKSNVHFGTGRRSKKELRQGAPKRSPTSAKVPRVARLMGLAIKFEQMVRDAEVKDYAEIARLGHVSRARMTQVMNLLNLAPDIQEHLLCHSISEAGKRLVTERAIRMIVKQPSWQQQHLGWRRLLSETSTCSRIGLRER